MRVFLLLLVLSLSPLARSNAADPVPAKIPFGIPANDEAFPKVKPGMTEKEVRALMIGEPKVQRANPLSWEYTGGRASGEPFPVTYMYYITFKNGLVERTEKNISDCIYQVPVVPARLQ
jgi:hypothetical protein